MFQWLHDAVEDLAAMQRATTSVWVTTRHAAGNGFSGMVVAAPDPFFAARRLLAELLEYSSKCQCIW